MSSLGPIHAQEPPPEYRINAPYFSGSQMAIDQGAIAWFGQVTNSTNYVDTRIAYNDVLLKLQFHIFDRWLWYDPAAASDAESFMNWDAVTVYLSKDGDPGESITSEQYRLTAQVSTWEGSRAKFQAIEQGNGSTWQPLDVPLTTTSSWRGNGYNSDTEEIRGWLAGFELPFSSLGLSGPPSRNSVWRMAVVLHDRDDASHSAIPTQSWPETVDVDRPSTWGELSFGMPTHNPGLNKTDGIITIRHKLDGAVVTDAHVGGHSVCGGDYAPNYFDGWGDANYAGYDQINIQNQWDVADWPCFSKFYIDFPLTSLPSGKSVISATLTMHMFGYAGYNPGDAQPSLLQVLTVDEAWSEETITWNNGPRAAQNVAKSWVEPGEIPGWPGVPVTWDVSFAVAEAYRTGKPLQMAIYSADGDYHSGKYFSSSDAGDWNEVARPTLKINLGTPVEPVAQIYLPILIK